MTMERVYQQVAPTEGSYSSARELMKMPSGERESILRLASEQVLDDYLHDSSLTDFEAFDPDVSY